MQQQAEFDTTSAAAESGGEQLDAGVLEVTAAVAADLELLAALHDCEPTREWLEAARTCALQEQLGLVLESETGRAALAALDAAVAELPPEIGPETLDALAAEYANIYFRYLYRAAPTKSVWLDEDSLERQAPMFAVKDWYRRHNLTSQDWAKRPDDHLVVELRFLSYLFANARTPEDLAEAAQFLDEHLLRWAWNFARRVAAESPSPYFAAAVLLTDAYLEELRDQLAAAADLPRRVPEPAASGNPKEPELTCADEVRPYVPGTAPGW